MTDVRSRLFGLYAITDQNLIPDNRFTEYVEAALAGGAGILQYRDKSADHEKRKLQAGLCRQLCEQYDALLIINDDIHLAEQVGAAGVHLGKDDNDLKVARDLLGEQAIIGISCYNDIERAVEAQQQGADYVAFGAMFSSSTKPDAVTAGPEIIPRAKLDIDIPICAIGGIDAVNASQAVTQGADMIAVISALFGSADIESTAKQLAEKFRVTAG